LTGDFFLPPLESCEPEALTVNRLFVYCYPESSRK